MKAMRHVHDAQKTKPNDDEHRRRLVLATVMMMIMMRCSFSCKATNPDILRCWWFVADVDGDGDDGAVAGDDDDDDDRDRDDDTDIGDDYNAYDGNDRG